MADQLISTAVHDRLPESYVRPETQRPRLDDVVADADIPVVDLANPDRAAVVAQIGDACRTHGFFQVLNHGVPVELMLAVAHEFFRLPSEEKAKLYSDDPAKKMRLSTSFNVRKETVHTMKKKMSWSVHYHSQPAPPASGPDQVLKIFCKAKENYCLAVHDGNVVLAPANAKDAHQHWYKDMRFSTKVNDAEGMPAFALVDKATGLAINHSLGQSHPVKLAPFNPDEEDASVLWTESKDVGKGFHCIRMVNNTSLGFDAFHGDKDHGGVHDGTTVVLSEWSEGDNQSWKILPWGPEADSPAAGLGIFSLGGEDFSLTVRNGATCLAPTNPRDDYRRRVKDMSDSKICDEEGYPAFALVNKVTGEPLQHSAGQGHAVKLVPYNPNVSIEQGCTWNKATPGEQQADGGANARPPLEHQFKIAALKAAVGAAVTALVQFLVGPCKDCYSSGVHDCCCDCCYDS